MTDWRRAADLALRWLGGLVAVWGAVMLALWGTFLTPLYAGSVRLPVSLVLAVVGNAAVVWFGWKTTGHRGATIAPAIVWLLLVAYFGLGRPEGDLGLVQQNWVALVYLLVGAATFGLVGYRLLMPPPLKPAPVPEKPPARNKVAS